jgi:hypothetical protein
MLYSLSGRKRRRELFPAASLVRREPVLSSALLAATLLAAFLAASAFLAAALLATTALLATLFLALAAFTFLSLAVPLLAALSRGSGFDRLVRILLCVHIAFLYY